MTDDANEEPGEAGNGDGGQLGGAGYKVTAEPEPTNPGPYSK